MAEPVLLVLGQLDDKYGQLVEALEAPFVELSQQVPLPDDQIRVMFNFILAVVLGLFMKSFIHGRTLRITFGMVFAIAMGVLQFGRGLYPFLFSVAAVYCMLRILPRNRVAIPIFIFSLGLLSYMHIYRMIYDYKSWRIDITAAQMIATCKFVSLAWNYQDGVLKKEDQWKLSDYHKTHVVTELPSLFEFLGYLMFAPCFLVGPIFEYTDYKNYVEEKDVFANIPSTVLPSLKILAQAFFWSILYMAIKTHFQLDYLVTEEYGSLSMLGKFAIMWVTLEGVKARYYSGFKFPEAAAIASGLGYVGKKTVNGKEVDAFGRLCNIRTRSTELGQSPKQLLDDWHITVTTWLRYYVYTRICPETQRDVKKSASVAVYTTFLVSAFWHGFYIPYYISFFQLALFGQVGKMFYTTEWAKYIPAPHVLRWVAIVWMWITFNYIGACFQLIDLGELIIFMKATYCIPFVTVIVSMVFFNVTGIHRTRRRTEKKDKTN